MLSIGQLSRRAGVKVPTIRYYEESGLMPPPDRTEGNQRRYSNAELERLGLHGPEGRHTCRPGAFRVAHGSGLLREMSSTPAREVGSATRTTGAGASGKRVDQREVDGGAACERVQ